MASRPLRLLLVGAHPADVFDQAGGTLAHHAAQGDQVTVVSLTTGVGSHDWELLDEKLSGKKIGDMGKRMKEARGKKLAEVKRACSFLGIEDVRTCDLDDEDEMLTRKLVDTIAHVIREVKPDIFITSHPYEDGGFKMHASVGQAGMYALRKAVITGRDDNLPAHITPAMFFMYPTSSKDSITLGNPFARIDLYVDITDVIEQKVKALDCISSQYYAGEYARKCVETSDGNFGRGGARVPYAEPFQRLNPPVRYTLNVSDSDLERCEGSIEKMVARLSHIGAATMPLAEHQKPATGYIMPKEKYDA